MNYPVHRPNLVIFFPDGCSWFGLGARDVGEDQLPGGGADGHRQGTQDYLPAGQWTRSI